MPRTQVEILIELNANLTLQLSAALARESELREANDTLARQLINPPSNPSSGGQLFNAAAIPEMVGLNQD